MIDGYSYLRKAGIAELRLLIPDRGVGDSHELLVWYLDIHSLGGLCRAGDRPLRLL